MKSIIIGDIHGCWNALNALTERLEMDCDADRLILLGDLFDRGPDSWEVFQTVRQYETVYKERFILLLGNHEDYLLQEKLPWMKRLMWDRVGRRATVNSFTKHGEMMESSAPWLREHCKMFYQDDSFQCVHAGILVHPPEINDKETLIHDHYVVLENRYTGPLTVTGHIALDEPAWFKGDKKTVLKLSYGKWCDLPAAGVICIDTGCGKGGKLTAMVIENGQYRLESVSES